MPSSVLYYAAGLGMDGRAARLDEGLVEGAGESWHPRDMSDPFDMTDEELEAALARIDWSDLPEDLRRPATEEELAATRADIEAGIGVDLEAMQAWAEDVRRAVMAGRPFPPAPMPDRGR